MSAADRLRWLSQKVLRRPWFRASLFSLFAIGAAVLAPIAERAIPSGWPEVIGARAVDGILGIIASSMLAVTVFSLTVMISVYSSAAQTVTPRAIRLLVEDSTAQNALSTFLGAFLFSLVGIISLSTNIYGVNGRVVLFGATLVVIVGIVVAMLRWIEHLSSFGQVADSMQRVEQAARLALEERRRHPRLGGSPAVPVPPGAHPVFASAIGYVRHIDMPSLAAAAGEHGAVHVEALPGTFVEPTRPLAWLGEHDADLCQSVRDAFAIGETRTFDEDPRFGLVVLAEIASRALSPGINDAGTAIGVIGAFVRLLAGWNDAETRASQPGEPIIFARVHVRSLSADDLLEDAFSPIARDGARVVEVGVRLQKALAGLSAGSPAMRQAARRQSQRALEHAMAQLTLEEDKRRIAGLAARLQH